MRCLGLALALATAAAAQPVAGPGGETVSADSIRAQARKAERDGDALRAWLLYAQAAGIDPNDQTSWGRAVALQPRALEVSRALGTNAAPLGTGGADAAPAPDADDLRQASRFRAPLRLQPVSGVRTFDLRGDSRALCEQMLRLYGIETIFDSEFQPVQNLRLRLEDAPFAEAAEALQLAAGVFLVPVSERMALVARDTPPKRQEFEHTMAVAVPIPTSMTVQEAQELARAVQGLMEIQKFGVDPNQRMAVIRDRESKALPALALFRDLIRHRGQVTVEVELLEASENSTLDLGVQLPTRFPVAWLSKVWNSAPSVPSGVSNLLTFGGGYSFLGIGLAGSQLIGTWAEGNARSLTRAEIRGVDGMAMNFHLGDKYPVLTGGYFGATSGTTGQEYTPPPTFNFEDLGVVLKITPRVHAAGEVTLEIESEYKVLTGEALNGIPVIASRKFNTSARLKMGEAAVIAGLLRASEARTLTGVAGLMQIPVLGHLFRTESRSKDSGQALLVIRPRLLADPAAALETRTVRTGPEGRPRLPL